jgi:signal transduction histidine kinase
VQQHELVVEASGPVTAWTDTRSLERIIGNLVGNAGKYSPAGTTIRIDVGQLPDEAFVAVSDQGPGIRPEDRERIFERFYRGHSQAARSSRGTGIGLAVVLAWVKAVGAHLDVQTGVGHGTTMTVRFPTGPDVPVDGAGAVTWKSVDVVREEIAT